MLHRPSADAAPRTDRAPAAAAAEPEWTPPSWEELVRDHSARVYRLAYRLTGNRPDAEDLTQDVFVRVFRSLSSYTPGTFEGWLHRITTNLFLDQVRRKQRVRFDALAEDAAERLPGREPSPDAAVYDRGFDADVQAALDSLSPEFRAAVVLCDVEGLSYEEVAATLTTQPGVQHACEGETSLWLALDPSQVRQDRIADSLSDAAPPTPAGASRFWSFEERAPRTGVRGDPRAATAEKGEAIFAAVTKALAAAMRDPVLWTAPDPVWEASRGLRPQ